MSASHAARARGYCGDTGVLQAGTHIDLSAAASRAQGIDEWKTPSLRKGERNMYENKTEVKARFVPAEDGSIKVVVFSAPESPPLLGAKAVRVRLLSQISTLLPTRSPFSLARRATRMTS